MSYKEIRLLLLNLIYASNTIKESISVEQRDQIAESILLLANENLIKLYKIIVEGKNYSKIKRQVDRKIGLISVIPVPGTIALFAIYKLVSRINYNCVMSCNKSEKNIKEKNLCYKKCNILSIEKAIIEVKKELNDCWYEKNPKKCRKSTIKYLNELYEKLEKSQLSLNNYKYKLTKGQNKNAKL